MKKLVNLLKQKSNTMVFRITSWYVLVTFVAVTLIGGVVITLVGTQLYQQVKAEADHVFYQLEEYGIESIDEIVHPNHEDALIQITDEFGRSIQSLNMQKLTSEYVESRSFLVGTVTILGHSKIPYLKLPYQTSNHLIEVFVDIKGSIEVIELLVETLFTVTVIGLICAMYVIYQLSKKINQPLAQMTQEINLERLEVTIPSGPQEINDLAEAFNKLGNLLEEKISRERQFISDASHELRTPLAAIRGHVNLIKRRGNSHPEVMGPSLDFIDHESLRMQRLIEQLLLISRLENDTKELPTTNLSKVLTYMVKDYHFIFEQTFVCEIEDGLMIKGNKDQIKQIVVSLLENARKYTPKDGEIRLVLKKHYELLAVIEVKDNGPGIADEEKQKIFERLYRVDPSRSSQISGTGLGLAITKQLVTLNNGVIDVRNNHPKGSIFIIEFPLYKEST